MTGLGVWEVDFILILVVVILAAGRLSRFGGAAGRGGGGLRKGPVSARPAPTPASSPPAPALVPSAPVAGAPAVSVPAGQPPAAAAPGSPLTADVAEAENKCPSCNTINPTGQMFCGQCGMRLPRAA
ncbi:MAG: zinc ribbon domain-containing protein [Chloroflexota bacterium]|nr:zinc ribbon domain-containing protein [Chloroflexota bacterium]